MAQLVLGAAGAVVGSYFGMPQLGWAIGSALGGALGQKTQKNRGPQLSDLKVTGTEYGQHIPYCIGHIRTAGQLIWASDRREIATTTEVGKGGPSAENTTFTYEVDVLYLLTDNEIAGVSRIWLNGKLIYTTLAASTGASVAASLATEAWTRVTVYTGSATQLPDPTYEAAVGTNNAPAYRDRGTIFIEGLQLGSSGQMPNLTFEVCRTATETATVTAVPQWSGVPTNSVVGFGMPAFSESTYLLPVIWNSPEVLDYYDINGATATPSSSHARPAGNFILGVTDETGVCVYNTSAPLQVTIIWGENASSSVFTVGTSGFNAPNVWAKRGDVVVLNNTTTSKITRFARAGGAAAAVTAGTYTIISLAIDDYIWAVKSTQDFIYQFDMSLTLLQTIPVPLGQLAELVFTNGDGDVYLQCQLNLYKWDGSTFYSWSSVDSLLSNHGGLGPKNSVVGDVMYAVRPHTIGWKLTKGDIALLLAPLNESVASVVSLLCLRAGLDASQFDVTALSSITRQVRGLATTQVGNTRALLELLATAYFFECVLSDKLYFRPRGAAAVATIPYADLGASSNPSGAAEPLALRPLYDLDIPAVVTVGYIDADADYERGAQSSDRIRSTSKTATSVDIALVLTASEAKGIADTMVLDQIASALTTKVALLDTYARLEPTDPIIATDEDGNTFRLRLVKLNAAAGVREFDAVLDDASVLTSAGITMPAATPSIVVSAPADTLLELMDIPILRDADNGPGIYGATKGSSSTGYPGSNIYESANDSDFDLAATVTEAAVFGSATTTLGNWTGGAVFDETNVLRVNVGNGTLSSSTRDAMQADGTVNAMLVGSEVVRFIRAVLISAGVYDLSGLLRGQRGTEWAISGHVASERVVLLRNAGLRRIVHETGEIGVELYYKGVTLGRRLSTAESEAFTDTGISLKPFAPVDLRAERDGTDTTLTWKRRTRLATRFVGAAGISVPLGEASESYDVELYDGAVLLQSDTVTEPEWSVSGLLQLGNLVVPVFGMRSISTNFVAVRDELPGTYTTTQYLVRFDSAGTYIDQSPAIGKRVYQFANNADNLYVCTADFNTAAVPVTFLNSKVFRLTRTAIGTIAATYTAATAGDLTGMAHDGTDLWVSEYYGGNVRKLNPTTLASVNTYAINAGIGAMQYDSGSLWIVDNTNSELVEWDIATTAEISRFSVVNSPYDLLIVGGVVFVLGADSVGAYTMATGALLSSQVLPTSIFLPQRNMVAFDGMVAVSSLENEVIFLDDTTGVEVRRASTPFEFLYYAAGADGTTLYLTGEPVAAGSTSKQTLSFELASPDLAGLTFKVWQNSASIGRGYQATLAL
jgi:hypothetical protein